MVQLGGGRSLSLRSWSLCNFCLSFPNGRMARQAEVDKLNTKILSLRKSEGKIYCRHQDTKKILENHVVVVIVVKCGSKDKHILPVDFPLKLLTRSKKKCLSRK